MLAREIMTRTIATVHPQTTLAEAIARMVDQRISALPVVDDAGKLVGIVSEGDMLRRIETGTEPSHAGWISLLLGPARLAREYVQSHGKTVGDVMTRIVETITEETSLADAVALMGKKRVKRLPVMRGDALVGILSRSDVVRVLGRTLLAAAGDTLSDGEIATRLRDELAAAPWANAHNVSVSVVDGVVTLEGVVFAESVRPAIRVAAQALPGVKAVEDRMVWLEPLTGTTLIA